AVGALPRADPRGWLLVLDEAEEALVHRSGRGAEPDESRACEPLCQVPVPRVDEAFANQLGQQQLLFLRALQPETSVVRAGDQLEPAHDALGGRPERQDLPSDAPTRGG